MENTKSFNADDLKNKFRNANDYETMIEVINSARGNAHPNCQHYTTIDRLLTKIRDWKWYLTRADNVRLNDLQENRKFGDAKLIPRIWQISFNAETAESAAMWALYCRQSPFAVRISVPYEDILNWVKTAGVERSKRCDGDAESIEIESKDFHDIFYAATDFRDKKKSRMDKSRKDGMSWNGAFANIENVPDVVRMSTLTGWVKDYEWRQEKEARIVVCTKKVFAPKSGLYLKVSQDLIKKMRFTLSPWLESKDESEVENIIKNALKSVDAWSSGRIHRSVLSGALNFSKE